MMEGYVVIKKVIRGESVMEKVPMEGVRYFHAKDKYVDVITHNSVFFCDSTLKQLCKDHPSLDRIHRSFAVNPANINKVVSGGTNYTGGFAFVQVGTENHKLHIARRQLARVRREFIAGGKTNVDQ